MGTARTARAKEPHPEVQDAIRWTRAVAISSNRRSVDHVALFGIVVIACVSFACGGQSIVQSDASDGDASVDARMDAGDALFIDAPYDGPDLPFPCGSNGLQCQSGTQYCEEVLPESQPNPSYCYCRSVDGCHTCECLNAQKYPNLGCKTIGPNPRCDEDAGGMTVHHQCY